MKDNQNSRSYITWAILGLLVLILIELRGIHANMKEVYLDTHFMTAQIEVVNNKIDDITNALDSGW